MIFGSLNLQLRPNLTQLKPNLTNQDQPCPILWYFYQSCLDIDDLKVPALTLDGLRV
jgi:hypothetical protein